MANFSQGSVRHNLKGKLFKAEILIVILLPVLKIKVWSDIDHINELCENFSPRKIAKGLTQRNSRR